MSEREITVEGYKYRMVDEVWSFQHPTRGDWYPVSGRRAALLDRLAKAEGVLRYIIRRGYTGASFVAGEYFDEVNR